MSSRNRFASFLQQMHQRLSDKLPQQGKLIEVAKKIIMVVAYLFLGMLA